MDERGDMTGADNWQRSATPTLLSKIVTPIFLNLSKVPLSSEDQDTPGTTGGQVRIRNFRSNKSFGLHRVTRGTELCLFDQCVCSRGTITELVLVSYCLV
ncbi:hypothetical protein RRG08_013393 [Elysia crispata]|uniref:Uncharacterized protein n=1 Tax=Elysia crispata TaxID=231223 RepID=A0AAE1EB62_9GAST|nr:hypothetical protein RRG08_013393 [Elysia crispata]